MHPMYQEYADKKASDIAEPDVLVMEESAFVADAASMMQKRDVSTVLVGSGTAPPIGIVTERDVLYRVVAEHRSPYKTTLKDVMSSPVVTVDESTPVREAIALMREKGIRRLPVTRGGSITGMLTLRSIIGNSPKKNIELIEVELPAAFSKIACPYCGSKFESKDDLSKHIDRIHLGPGLLEGDLRKW